MLASNAESPLAVSRDLPTPVTTGPGLQAAGQPLPEPAVPAAIRAGQSSAWGWVGLSGARSPSARKALGSSPSAARQPSQQPSKPSRLSLLWFQPFPAAHESRSLQALWLVLHNVTLFTKKYSVFTKFWLLLVYFGEF